jgi:post-segregation antitoxin (ccd killing protein)
MEEVTPTPDDGLGRPRLNKHRRGAATCVSVRLTDVTYDELYLLHRETGIDISTLIREAIEARLLRDRRQTPR